MDDRYRTIVHDASRIVDAARSSAVQSVNAAMTAAYWMIGQRVVEFEQSGAERAAYGAALMERLAEELSRRFGRGFSRQNLQQMRRFYLSFRADQICQTPSGDSDDPSPERIRQTPSGKLEIASPEARLAELRAVFPLPWSAYVRLLAVKNVQARKFYETEALRGGWSVRQLERQIGSQFYERTAHSKNKAAMLARGRSDRTSTRPFPKKRSRPPSSSSSLISRTSIPRAAWKTRWLAAWRRFCWRWGATSASSGRQRHPRVGNEWYRN